MDRSETSCSPLDRVRMLVASQEREPFEQALAANRHRLLLKHHATPLAALSRALGQPHPATIIFIDHALVFAQEIGAIRLALESDTAAQLVIMTEPEGSSLEERLAAEGVRFHPFPRSGEEVLTLVEEALGPLHPWRELSEPIFDLVQGVADAVNNPLTTLAGFLQILEQQVEPGQDTQTAFTEIKRALAQLTRVARDLEVAGGGCLGREESFELAPRLSRIAADISDLPPVTYLEEDQGLTCTGDRALFDRAVHSLIHLARRVAAEGVTLQVTSGRAQEGVFVQVLIPALTPARWRADRTFHPFFLSRALRLPEIGLAPAVAAGASRNLGGRVEASWDQEDALRLTMLLS